MVLGKGNKVAGPREEASGNGHALSSREAAREGEGRTVMVVEDGESGNWRGAG